MTGTDRYASREVSAVLQIGRTTVPINRVVLRHTIDELPTAEIHLQLDNLDVSEDNIQGLVSMDIEKFRKLTQLFQEKIINEFRVRPNVVLTVKDPNGVNLVMNGFLAKPALEIQEGLLQIQVSLTHAAAALQAWNGQIYNYVEPYVLPNFTDAFGEAATSEAQQSKKNNSVALRVLALAQYAMRAVDMVPNADNPLEFDMLPIHQLNQKAMSVVEEVLKASAKTTEIDGLKDDEFDPTNLHHILFETLRNSPNMWQVLKQLGEMFLFQINADWKGNLWMEPIQSIDPPGDRIISVPLAHFRFNCAHLYELPITQVIVVGQGLDRYVFSGMMGTNMGAQVTSPVPVAAGEFYAGRVVRDGELWTRLQCLSKYPPVIDSTLAGNFFVLNAPSWINVDAILDAQVDQLSKGVDASLKPLERVVTMQHALQDSFLKADRPRQKLLSYLAKQLFQSLYLGSTYASITVPFDLRPCVGRTYTVADMDGNKLFRGFLRDAYHNLLLNADGAADASTILVFSHIIVEGAVLKHLVRAEELDKAASTSIKGYTDNTARTEASIVNPAK